MRRGLVTAFAVVGLVGGVAGVLRGEGTLPTEGGDGADGGEIEYTVCGQGVLKECGKITQQKCTQWVPTSGGGGFTIQPTGGGLTGQLGMTCSSMTTTETKIYKDRYLPKAP